MLHTCVVFRFTRKLYDFSGVFGKLYDYAIFRQIVRFFDGIVRFSANRTIIHRFCLIVWFFRNQCARLWLGIFAVQPKRDLKITGNQLPSYSIFIWGVSFCHRHFNNAFCFVEIKSCDRPGRPHRPVHIVENQTIQRCDTDPNGTLC